MVKVNKAKNRIKFLRKFATCDPRDYAIEFGTTQFLLAIAPRVPVTLNSTYVEKAIHYSSILEKPVPQTELEEEIRIINITAIDAEVPSVVTSYWCGLLELPKYLQRQKHHAVRFTALITPGNEDIVHHMEIYNCYKYVPKGTKFNGNCMEKPRVLQSCSKVVAAWAFGADTLDYPKEAGMPVGGEGYVPYLMVEIHYNNPFKHQGRIDNSGFTITLTPQLRPNDAGITEYGLIYSDANSIPPGQSAFAISGFCVPQCTKHLPKDGIRVFATQQHAHLTGRKIRTVHYRKGVKMGYINFDDHYTAHWQVIRRLENHVHVLPGDVIQTTCSFETSHLNRWTWGGYGIDDEMCVNYMFYYPASDLEVCKTAISNITLDHFFKRHLPNENLTGLGIHEKYEKLNLDEELVQELSEWYDVQPLKVDCLDHSGQLFPVSSS
uniref:Peptidylglycine monooxygenase n=1 Tax=Bursaphelenchus xylophilus TaxID=6326 RepID=A0A1I7S9J0_BURXY